MNSNVARAGLPLLTEHLVVVVFDLRGDFHVVDQEVVLFPLVQPDLLAAEGEGEGAEEEGVAAGDDGEHVAPPDLAGAEAEVVRLLPAHRHHVTVVPAGRVGEDHDQHEDTGEKLKDSAELEELLGGGEADGEPDDDGADCHHHGEAGEDGGGPEGGGEDGGEVLQSSSTHLKAVTFSPEIRRCHYREGEPVTTRLSTTATARSLQVPQTEECLLSTGPAGTPPPPGWTGRCWPWPTPRPPTWRSSSSCWRSGRVRWSSPACRGPGGPPSLSLTELGPGLTGGDANFLKL